MDENLSGRESRCASRDVTAHALARAWQTIRVTMQTGEDRGMRAPLLTALVIVLALMAITVAALRTSYDTNDDVFMTMIVSGRGFCPAPDEHLIFSNVLVGRVLKHLYVAWPGVPWYGGYLLLVHYLAQVALLYAALSAGRERLSPGEDQSVESPAADARRKTFRRRLVTYLVYFVIVEVVLLNTFQFTTTAFLAGQAGVFLVWLAVWTNDRQPWARLVATLTAAVALIVLAGLIRLESLYMVLLAAAPLGLLLLWRSLLRALAPGAIAAMVAATLVLAATRYNQATYESDPAWNRFYAYNQLRCKFNDYQWTTYTPETAHVFEAVGWSKIDHDMMARWFFDDPVMYSEANLSSVLAAHPWKTARWSPGYLLEAFRRPLQDRSVWAVLLVLPFILSRSDRGRPERRVFLSCAILVLGMLLAVSLNNKAPPMRLYFPLLAFPLSAALLLPATAVPSSDSAGRFVGLRDAWHNWSRHPALTQAIVVMLIVGIAMGVYRQGRRSTRVARGRVGLQEFLADARAERHKLYVCWEAALPFELVSPLDNLEAWSDISILNLTWTQRTAWQDTVKRRFGISCLARAICERNDIVLVATPAHRELFETFANEHFQARLEYLASRNFGTRSSAGSYRRQVDDKTASRPTGQAVP